MINQYNMNPFLMFVSHMKNPNSRECELLLKLLIPNKEGVYSKYK